MDTITNEILVPTERIEEAIRQAAVPGWWGSLSIVLQLQEISNGLYELNIHVTRQTTTQNDLVREVGILPMSDRVTEALRKFRDVRHRLKIIIPAPELKCNFKDGQITGPFQLVEKYWIPPKP